MKINFNNYTRPIWTFCYPAADFYSTFCWKIIIFEYRMLTGLLREENAVPVNDRKRKKDAKDNKKRDGAAPPLDRIPLPNIPVAVLKGSLPFW
jgi:hypothetical protein